MKVAASMSVGRLAPKHSLDIDGIRAISPNVTPELIEDDVVIIDRLGRPDGSHMTIEEYTNQHFQPYIDQYNAKTKEKLDKEHEYFLSGLLKCPSCGGPMYGIHNGRKKKKDGTYYKSR